VLFVAVIIRIPILMELQIVGLWDISSTTEQISSISFMKRESSDHTNICIRATTITASSSDNNDDDNNDSKNKDKNAVGATGTLFKQLAKTLWPHDSWNVFYDDDNIINPIILLRRMVTATNYVPHRIIIEVPWVGVW
jgi:hypothetical protein